MIRSSLSLRPLVSVRVHGDWMNWERDYNVEAFIVGENFAVGTHGWYL